MLGINYLFATLSLYFQYEGLFGEGGIFDFLGGDLLIIDDSLQIVDYEFDSIETPLEEIIEILQPETTDSNISLNVSNEELFKISHANELMSQASIEELVSFDFKYQL